MKKCNVQSASGFTLLEVLVALTVLAVGAAVAMSLISGSGSSIRKVQMRTKIMEHAQEIMEAQLLDDTILSPTSLGDTLDDGTIWSLSIDQYTPELSDQLQSAVSQTQNLNLQYQLLQYTLEVTGSDPSVGKYTLQTLKLTKVSTSK
jgi:prepilin-type N-terminal cleavage/methylation domain-containing protein